MPVNKDLTILYVPVTTEYDVVEFSHSVSEDLTILYITVTTEYDVVEFSHSVSEDLTILYMTVLSTAGKTEKKKHGSKTSIKTLDSSQATVTIIITNNDACRLSSEKYKKDNQLVNCLKFPSSVLPQNYLVKPHRELSTAQTIVNHKDRKIQLKYSSIDFF